jgi:polyisoprenoid-binding protein YceI
MSRLGRLVVAGVIAVALLVGGYWLLSAPGSDPPAPAALGSEPSATAGQPGSTRAGSSGTVQGTWKVRDGSDSFVGYRVREQLTFLQSPSDAVGRTRAVTGSLRVAGDRLEAATIQADLTQLTSDQSRRDNAVRQQGLQSERFPMATFQLVQPITLPSGLARGQTVKADAKGRLTVHGTTRDVALPLQGRWNGDTIQVAGALKIAMTDYGIQPPRLGPVVSIDDAATVEVQLVFQRG